MEPIASPAQSRRKILFWSGLTLATFTTITGNNELILDLTWLLFAIAITIGPHCHTLTPRTATAASLPGILLILDGILELIPTTSNIIIGPLWLSEYIFLLAYLALAIGLIKLPRPAGHTHRATALTDALATAVATFLAFWTVASGAVHGGEDLPHALVMATYPAMDILLLSLSTHLAIQRRNIPASLWWLIGTLTAVTALDATLSTYELIAPADTPAILDSLQAFTVFGMSVVVLHPTFPRLFTYTPPPQHAPRAHIALLPLTLSPTALAAATPATNTIDALARAFLVILLLALVALRLWITFGHLNTAVKDSTYRATHDQLTGLPNRAATLEALNHKLLNTTPKRHNTTAVIFLDLDEFKSVNDQHGHDIGDQLLRHIAAILSSVTRPEDIVGRYGGDEFVIIADGLTPTDAQRVAERILNHFTAPLPLREGITWTATFSIGIALATPDTTYTPQQLLAQADAAMYNAKNKGKGRWAIAT